MLYCTYDQYQTAGGTLDEAAFDTLCARASRLIDRHTFGRAEPHARACAGCAALLADACVQIVDAMSAAQSACAVPGASSVSKMATLSPSPAGRFLSGLQRKRRASSPIRWAMTPTACCIGGVSDAVQRYRCEPHPRHRHRDRPACLPRHPRLQLAGEAGHLRRRPPADGARPAAPCGGLPALFPVGKAPARGKGGTLDAQAGRQAHLRRCPQPDRGRVCRPRENLYLLHGGGGLRQPGTAAAAFSCRGELRG